MKQAGILSITLVLGIVIGYGVFRVSDSILVPDSDVESGEGTAESGILYWVAPMDPNYRRDKPGKSPMGMDLVPVYSDEHESAAGEVHIEPHVIQNLGIRTAPVLFGPLARQIDTVGYVEYDENALQHIHTRVDGWVEQLFVKAEGDPVKQNEALFELYSRTLVNAQQEYLLAKSENQIALKSASSDRLVALGMTQSELVELDESQKVKDRVRVVADTDGVVAMLGIREGVYVTPSTHVMSIADLDRVWILAEVMERYSDAIKVGQRATFEVDSKPGRQFDGEVDYIYPDLDATTRSLKVRIGYSAEKGIFRPNMLARVSIYVPSEDDVYSVPTSAVIRGGISDRVVLSVTDGKFKSTPVTVGFESGERTVIWTGVEENDRVVVSGQFLIDSESNISTSLARFDSAANDG